MHNQPKFIPLRESDFFSDGRSARPLVPGTIARGQLQLDRGYFTGTVNGVPVVQFPFPVTREVLQRGQERFNIFCSPCHGRLGNGEGIIVQRGFRPPPSYHTGELRKAPIGHFVDVITNGYRSMPSYATRVPPRDRWAIAAYIRALQLSQNATPADVPEDQRQALGTK